MEVVANVAQLVEQLTRNEQVTGSNPVIGSVVEADNFPPLLPYGLTEFNSNLLNNYLAPDCPLK